MRFINPLEQDQIDFLKRTAQEGIVTLAITKAQYHLLEQLACEERAAIRTTIDEHTPADRRSAIEDYNELAAVFGLEYWV